VLTCPAQMRLQAQSVAEGDQMNFTPRQAFIFLPGTTTIDDRSRPFDYPANTVPPSPGAPFKPMRLSVLASVITTSVASLPFRDVDQQVDTAHPCGHVVNLRPNG